MRHHTQLREAHLAGPLQFPRRRLVGLRVRLPIQPGERRPGSQAEPRPRQRLQYLERRTEVGRPVGLALVLGVRLHLREQSQAMAVQVLR